MKVPGKSIWQQPAEEGLWPGKALGVEGWTETQNCGASRDHEWLDRGRGDGGGVAREMGLYKTQIKDQSQIRMAGDCHTQD